MLAAKFKVSKQHFVVEETEKPVVGGDEVLVETKAAGICGSDVHYRNGDSSPAKIPLVMGHEGAGVVVEKGERVTYLELGDRVVIHYPVSCGRCKQCTQGFDNRCRYRKSIGHDVDGTFSQYIKAPGRNAIPLPARVPMELGAIAACAVSTAFHALTISGVRKGDTVLVFGAGGVGLHAVMWARFFGAGKVIAVDPVESKLRSAKKYGADVALDPVKEDVLEGVARETGGWGVDVAVECSGSSKAMEQAIKAIKGKNHFETGTLISVGLQTAPFQATFSGLREGRLAVSGDHTMSDLVQVIGLIDAGRVDLSESVTHRIGLREINEGLDLVEARKEHVERIVIDRFA